jgi:hypothetical protein
LRKVTQADFDATLLGGLVSALDRHYQRNGSRGVHSISANPSLHPSPPDGVARRKKELDSTPEYLGERISALLVTEVGVADKNRTQETESGKIRY